MCLFIKFRYSNDHIKMIPVHTDSRKQLKILYYELYNRLCLNNFVVILLLAHAYGVETEHVIHMQMA